MAPLRSHSPSVAGTALRARLRRRPQRGAYIVEFALALMIMIVLLIGTLDVCRLLWIRIAVTELARNGSRYASVRGSISELNKETIRDEIISHVKAASAGVMEITSSVSWTQVNGKESLAPGSVVTVNVSHPFRWTLLPLPDVTLQSTSTMTVSF